MRERAPLHNTLGAPLQYISGGCAVVLCASPSATRLRWPCDRDPVECALYFYFARASATPEHTQGAQAIAMHAVAMSQGCLAHCRMYADSYSCTLWGRDEVRRVCVGRAIAPQSNALRVQVRARHRRATSLVAALCEPPSGQQSEHLFRASIYNAELNGYSTLVLARGCVGIAAAV